MLLYDLLCVILYKEDEKMRNNILRDPLVNNIFISYMDNDIKRVIEVVFRFMDTKQIYFSAPRDKVLVKPKKKTSVDLKVYSIDGVYKSCVVVNDSQYSLDEVLFELSLPKLWEFNNLRSSSRNRVTLDINIKYNDGFEINTTTYDLALGGIAFYSKEKFPEMYEKFTAILTMKLPKEMWLQNPDGKFVIETAFVRMHKEDNDEKHFGEYLYCYKFINIPKDEQDLIRAFLIQKID